MQNNMSEYIQQEVDSADPVRLIDLLYSRALRDLEGARELWPNRARQAEAIRLAVHAQLILRELYNAVNVQDGGELARHLRMLYEYMQYELMEAIAHRGSDSLGKISGVLELLEPLAAAWSSMSREQSESKSAALVEGGSLVA